MAVKNLLQDVVPPPRRSIRNVPVPSYRKKEPGTKIPLEIKEDVKMPPPRSPKKPLQSIVLGEEPQKPQKKSRFFLWLILLILIIGGLFVYTTFLASAKVVITPRQQKVTFDEMLRAGDLDTGISYEVVTLSKSEGKTVLATENEAVEDRASGIIIVYNNFNASTQRLVKNTRFETPEGLIFRIKDSVNVPGQTKKDGQTVPGSAEVEVYADTPGEKYNTGLTDFTIPGFKGDPRYQAFYGRSKTPMTGGFVGVKKKISADVRKGALGEIETGLRDMLATEVKTQIPENFVFFEEVLFYEFEEVSQTEVKNDSVKINLKGTVRAAIFDRDALEEFLADQTTPALNNEKVEVIGLENLTVITKNKDKIDIKTHPIFEVGIAGQAVVAALFPEDVIQNELVGGSKKSLQSVLSKYTSIQEAEAVLRPFWKRSFPTDVKKIKIEKVILE